MFLFADGLRRNTTRIYVFSSYPGDIMTWNPIAHNALRNTGTWPKTVPMPEHSGTVFLRYRHGWPKKTPGPPMQNTNHRQPYWSREYFPVHWWTNTISNCWKYFFLLFSLFFTFLKKSKKRKVIYLLNYFFTQSQVTSTSTKKVRKKYISFEHNSSLSG